MSYGSVENQGRPFDGIDVGDIKSSALDLEIEYPNYFLLVNQKGIDLQSYPELARVTNLKYGIKAEKANSYTGRYFIYSPDNNSLACVIQNYNLDNAKLSLVSLDQSLSKSATLPKFDYNRNYIKYINGKYYFVSWAYQATTLNIYMLDGTIPFDSIDLNADLIHYSVSATSRGQLIGFNVYNNIMYIATNVAGSNIVTTQVTAIDLSNGTFIQNYTASAYNPKQYIIIPGYIIFGDGSNNPSSTNAIGFNCKTNQFIYNTIQDNFPVPSGYQLFTQNTNQANINKFGSNLAIATFANSSRSKMGILYDENKFVEIDNFINRKYLRDDWICYVDQGSSNQNYELYIGLSNANYNYILGCHIVLADQTGSSSSYTATANVILDFAVNCNTNETIGYDNLIIGNCQLQHDGSMNANYVGIFANQNYFVIQYPDSTYYNANQMGLFNINNFFVSDPNKYLLTINDENINIMSNDFVRYQ